MTDYADISVMLLPADDGDGMEVTVFDDDQPILNESIIDLVAQWAELESIEGQLHPYLDGTLNVVSDLTYALIKVLERVEPDDLHAVHLRRLFTEAYQYAQALVHRLAEPDA